MNKTLFLIWNKMKIYMLTFNCSSLRMLLTRPNRRMEMKRRFSLSLTSAIKYRQLQSNCSFRVQVFRIAASRSYEINYLFFRCAQFRIFFPRVERSRERSNFVERSDGNFSADETRQFITVVAWFRNCRIDDGEWRRANFRHVKVP